MRKKICPEVDSELYTQLKIIAIKQNKGIYELLEEGMKNVINKYNIDYNKEAKKD